MKTAVDRRSTAVFTFLRLCAYAGVEVGSCALGVGLLLSLLIPGWFARALIGAVLIGIGCLAGCCT